MHHRPQWLIGLLLVVGCAGEPVDRPLDAAALWHIDSVPELVIGDSPDDTTVVIGLARGAFALPVGGVVVGDQDLHGIRY
ncbi:MAG TPA: hypothetical protein PLL69_12720, partial [Gemmatimonadales bacterium]|nr:hypothetical protein [Gemmatimonadales bacterium]